MLPALPRCGAALPRPDHRSTRRTVGPGVGGLLVSVFDYWAGVAEQLRAETHIENAEDEEWYQSKRLALTREFRP